MVFVEFLYLLINEKGFLLFYTCDSWQRARDEWILLQYCFFYYEYDKLKPKGSPPYMHGHGVYIDRNIMECHS